MILTTSVTFATVKYSTHSVMMPKFDIHVAFTLSTDMAQHMMG